MIYNILFGFYAFLVIIFFLFLYYNTKQHINFKYELYSKLPLNQTWNLFSQSFKNSLFSPIWPHELEKITSGGVETNAHLNITYTLNKLKFSKEYKFSKVVPNSEISYTTNITNSKQSFLGKTTITFSTISSSLYNQIRSNKHISSDNLYSKNIVDITNKTKDNNNILETYNLDLNDDYNNLKFYQEKLKHSLFNSSSLEKLKQSSSLSMKPNLSNINTNSKTVTKITWVGNYTFRGFSLSATFLSKLYNKYFFKKLQDKLDKL